MMAEKQYQYSEIFGNTIQGEGQYTGVPTVWVRFWGCNLNCNGFGQTDPTDPSSWILDYQTIDISSITKMEDLPVFNRGCDSSYSWSKNYAHLAHKATAAEICDKLEAFMKNEHNPEGKFLHPKSKQWQHMAFTGGEPMMSQNAIVDIMLEFAKRNNVPKYVTVETNGTQKARDKISDYIRGYPVTDDAQVELFNQDFDYEKSFYMAGKIWMNSESLIGLTPELEALKGVEWFWSVSPKLFLSGETWEDAIKPEIVASYKELSNAGQLKYVSDGSQRSWDEIEKATALFREAGVNWKVWVMPVGATVDGQNLVAAKVTEEAVARGYNVAARVHAYIFQNIIGR
jgi:7-carboxy-7-deazaguanine synthase